MKAGKLPGCLVFGVFTAVLSILAISCRRPDNSASESVLLDAHAENLPATHVSATLDCPIHPGTNLVWCGTMQLAWNQAADSFGGKLELSEDVPLVAQLNRREFTTNEIDQTSYIIVGGPTTSRALERIRSETSHKFGNSFQTALNIPTNIDEGLIFYAGFQQNLEFENDFLALNKPLLFGTNRVAAFGLDIENPNWQKLHEQIHLLDFRGSNDFIVELITKSKNDRLILAKVPPLETLAETAKHVTQRMAHPDPKAAELVIQNCAIPKLNFQILRQYDELLQKHLALPNPQQASNWTITFAEQLIRFRLDQKGALLESEAGQAMATAAVDETSNLIFDRPYLLLMQRVNAKTPYFSLWIDNTELLVPWN